MSDIEHSTWYVAGNANGLWMGPEGLALKGAYSCFLLNVSGWHPNFKFRHVTIFVLPLLFLAFYFAH